MADYKKMYFALFNKITDVIEELQEIQAITEEMYMDSRDNIIEMNSKKDNGSQQ